MTKVFIVLDPGHGGSDRANVGPTGYIEADGNLKVATYLKGILEERYSNVEVTMTREADVYVSLSSRGQRGAGSDLFHSIHTNAGPATAKGCEVYYSVDLPYDHSFAATMSKAIAAEFGTADRGAKVRESTKYPGEDYYTVIDTAQDNGAKHVLLSESLFHSNAEEEQILKDDQQLKKIAEIMADTYGQFLTLEKRSSETPIISKASATVGQSQAWSKSKGASQEFIDLAPLFFEIAQEVGVDPAGAYAQSAKETGYGKFGGVLDASYHNPCGMKTSQGGGNYDPNAHMKFDTWDDGIAAQIDHLALYAGAPGYPKTRTMDPRHFSWIAGKADTWEGLGGNWAGSADYGTSIVTMMKQIIDTEEPKPTESIEDLKAQLAAMAVRAYKAEEKLSRIKAITEE